LNAASNRSGIFLAVLVMRAMPENNPSRREITERIRELIGVTMASTAPVLPDEITEDSAFEKPPLCMDSLDFAQLMVGIEDAFGLSICDSDFLRLVFVRDAVELVCERMSRPL
jgi:acyl carrier protein